MLTIEVKDRWDNENKIIVMIDKIENITEYRGLATIHLTSKKSIEVWHSSSEVREMIESAKNDKKMESNRSSTMNAILILKDFIDGRKESMFDSMTEAESVAFIKKAIAALEEYQNDMDKYLDYTTGGRCSKSFNSDFVAIKQVHDEHIEALIIENVKTQTNLLKQCEKK